MSRWSPALRHGLLIGLAAILGACVTVTTYVPAREFLVGGVTPPPGFGAYGYLLFTSRPGALSQKRYLATCDAFLRNLEPLARYPDTDRALLMPTYWPLERGAFGAADLRNCVRLIEVYDYATAKPMAAALGKLASSGPLLVAWKAPYPQGRDLGDELVLDLSAFADEDLDRALGIWMERIARDPSVWNKGFNWLRITEAFRNFIQKYGGEIVRVATHVRSTRPTRLPCSCRRPAWLLNETRGPAQLAELGRVPYYLKMLTSGSSANWSKVSDRPLQLPELREEVAPGDQGEAGGPGSEPRDDAG